MTPVYPSVWLQLIYTDELVYSHWITTSTTSVNKYVLNDVLHLWLRELKQLPQQIIETCYSSENGLSHQSHAIDGFRYLCWISNSHTCMDDQVDRGESGSDSTAPVLNRKHRPCHRDSHEYHPSLPSAAEWFHQEKRTIYENRLVSPVILYIAHLWLFFCMVISE